MHGAAKRFPTRSFLFPPQRLNSAVHLAFMSHHRPEPIEEWRPGLPQRLQARDGDGFMPQDYPVNSRKKFSARDYCFGVLFDIVGAALVRRSRVSVSLSLLVCLSPLSRNELSEEIVVVHIFFRIET